MSLLPSSYIYIDIEWNCYIQLKGDMQPFKNRLFHAIGSFVRQHSLNIFTESAHFYMPSYLANGNEMLAV